MLTLDSQHFRQHVGLFATGVAVISCTDPEVSYTDLDYTVHGATVNSFTSVSLRPPTVMVSLSAGRAHQFITGNGHFGASILTDARQSCSDYFAGLPARRHRRSSRSGTGSRRWWIASHGLNARSLNDSQYTTIRSS